MIIIEKKFAQGKQDVIVTHLIHVFQFNDSAISIHKMQNHVILNFRIPRRVSGSSTSCLKCSLDLGLSALKAKVEWTFSELPKTKGE